jgi:hypothetical protein
LGKLGPWGIKWTAPGDFLAEKKQLSLYEGLGSMNIE